VTKTGILPVHLTDSVLVAFRWSRRSVVAWLQDDYKMPTLEQHIENFFEDAERHVTDVFEVGCPESRRIELTLHLLACTPSVV